MLKLSEDVQETYLHYLSEDMQEALETESVDEPLYHNLYVNSNVLIALDDTRETANIIYGLLYPIWNSLEYYEAVKKPANKLTSFIEDMKQ